MLALALLVVGGMALVNALTGSSSKDPGSAAPPAASESGDSGASAGTPAAPRTSRPAQSPAAAQTPLVIRVTGAPTQVYVRGTTSGDVFHSGVLGTGEARKYDQVPLSVVAVNGGSVEVTIYGEVQERKPSGTRGEWFVPER
ncbi:hypothetical protein [Spirillospora sp. NPDC029432]|uniref:hypothetical protein n=1 Tax=Spirillospora sp. NPDC029432 TaxID=3154599 RepID=UPI00345486AE